MNLKKFIKKYKVTIIVVIVCLTLLILAFFAVFSMFNPIGDKNDGRFENAPLIDNDIIEKTKEDILDNEFVISVDYEAAQLSPKIVFYINVKEGTEFVKVDQLDETILENLGSEIVSFYDIEIAVLEPTGVDKMYPIIGYHSPKSEEVSWTDSLGDEDEE